MKKIMFVILFVLALTVLPALPAMDEEQKSEPAPAQKSAPGDEIVTKTYTLKYVSPDFIEATLKGYTYGPISYARGSNVLTVHVQKKDLAEFEEQLRKLDVEKKQILLRIFTVIASKEEKGDAIENKELRRVLAEVSNLLNFKSYALDGVSVISSKDGANRGNLVLSSGMIGRLDFDFGNLSVVTNGAGKRSVRFEFQLEQTANNQTVRLMRSETEIAENGYLLAGVSRITDTTSNKTLVLVISAEIK